ncbi:MAG: transaldolase [Bacteroidetes bacterium]|nr:transaldolase [Bacteroidota bacterium]
MMNAVRQLEKLGQSIWFDNISRGLVLTGRLKKMVDEGLLGVTSNPSIFDEAISGSADYDDQIRELVEANSSVPVEDIIQALMARDIQMAADVLSPVYERTKGRDGYVSVEVAPSKARDTRATIEEARVLWSGIDRKNLMVKIPATREGLPAVEQAISEGININVTLIFSCERYREVAEAYTAGLEKRLRDGKPVDHVASVASVFVSRIDTLVDRLIEEKIAAGGDVARVDRLRGYRGKAAVANSRRMYQDFKEMFSSPRFKTLEENGARRQRPLWASTGTKNPAYSNLLYVDSLVAPDTVNTVPPQTYAAILDHLQPAVTVENELDAGNELLESLSEEGVDLGWVMRKLEDDGVAQFASSFDGLYKNLLEKRDKFVGTSVPN